MSAGPLCWHLITGEYPPLFGGVSEYTRQVARALVEAGDRVTVWAPEAVGVCPEEGGVTVRHLSGTFGPQALRQLSNALRCERRPFRLLVQYVPQMYGYRGVNLAFCLWLSSLHRYRPWVMFHEVAFPWGQSYSARQHLLSGGQQFMAWLLLRRCRRVFVSIPGWEPMLRRLLPRGRRPEWLPIPSNLPVTAAPAARAALRATLVPQGGFLLGHFGTYGEAVAPLLTAVLPAVLERHENRRVLLLGRGSCRFAKKVQCGHPYLAHRLVSAGEQPPDAAAGYLSACDLLIQPFSDGVSSRRTTLMAGLALGVPIVTNRGHLTEPLWSGGAVALTDSPSARAYQEAVTTVLESSTELERLGRAGADCYRRWFALERTVSILRKPAKW